MVYSHDATFALAFLANVKELVARKYAKDIWTLNFRHYVNMTFTEIHGPNAAPWQSCPEYANNYTLLKEHLLNRFNEEMAENAANEQLAVSCPTACLAFERAAILQGFNHPSRTEMMVEDTPPPRETLPFGVACVQALLTQ